MAQKRLEARKVYTSCCVIFQYCLQKGIHVAWEMSERSLAWRLPIIQQLKKKCEVYEAVTSGCAVNKRDKAKGRFLQKGFRVITTHARLQRMLELPCRCPKSYVHAACTGKVAEGSGVYTPEYAQRVAKSVLQELEYQGVQQESQGRSKLLETFGNGETCFCKDLQIPSLPEQKCTSCWPRALGIQASGTSDRVLEASGRDLGTAQASDPQVSQVPFGSTYNPEQAQQVDQVASEAKARELNQKQDYSFQSCEALLELTEQDAAQ